MWTHCIIRVLHTDQPLPQLSHSAGWPLPVNGSYSTAWRKTRMASCSAKLSVVYLMGAYLSDWKTTTTRRNRPEC
ncbi:Caleosin [Zea mays]|uniref:Caleosin n=1 Tax=Zea mays TaxID=4577 RepID=A0A1D6JTL5_MAIZE|nr:Caleosin [Zea mays]